MPERAARPRRGRRWLASLLAVGVLVGATVLSVVYFVDLKTLVHVLEAGRWPWIAAGIAVHLVFFLTYALLYKYGFAVVGVASRTWSLVPVLFAGLFVNLVVPTGAGAGALFVDDAIRRGQSGARAAVGVILVLLLDLLTIVPFIAWGLVFLVQERLFEVWQLLAVGAFVMYLVLLVLLLVLSRSRQAGVCRVLAWCDRAVHRVLGWLHIHTRRAERESDWATRTAEGFAEAAGAIVASPGRLALAGFWALAIHVINAFGLWLFVRGFGADVPIGGLIASFGLGLVLVVVGAVPQLAPLAQAFMTETLIDAGVAAGPATAATLAFRGLTLGMPLVLGLPFAWRIARFGTRKHAAATERRG